MATAEQSIDVNVPISTAYNQWTQFEGFPQFMTDVESVEQLDDRRLHWVVKIAGVRREFDAEITEQRPEERIGWRSTRGVVSMVAERDMKRFKEFIESRGAETGAWRGEIPREG